MARNAPSAASMVQTHIACLPGVSILDITHPRRGATLVQMQSKKGREPHRPRPPQPRRLPADHLQRAGIGGNRHLAVFLRDVARDFDGVRADRHPCGGLQKATSRNRRRAHNTTNRVNSESPPPPDVAQRGDPRQNDKDDDCDRDPFAHAKSTQLAQRHQPTMARNAPSAWSMVQTHIACLPGVSILDITPPRPHLLSPPTSRS